MCHAIEAAAQCRKALVDCYNLQFWILGENAFCAVIEGVVRTVRRAAMQSCPRFAQVLPGLRPRPAHALLKPCPDLPSSLPDLYQSPAKETQKQRQGF